MTTSHAMKAYYNLSEQIVRFRNGEITKKEFDKHIKAADAENKRLSTEIKKIKQAIKDGK